MVAPIIYEQTLKSLSLFLRFVKYCTCRRKLFHFVQNAKFTDSKRFAIDFFIIFRYYLNINGLPMHRPIWQDF